MAEADVEGDADDAFELVSGQPRPSSAAAGSARLASKPARPAEYRVRGAAFCCCLSLLQLGQARQGEGIHEREGKSILA